VHCPKDCAKNTRKSVVADAIAYAIDQPDGIDVGEIVIRPTIQAG
jgi:NADP-dependent 3-hydroxy acid dehydrogenase YdfG